ncbi:MAG: DUF2975 domain-containing protein [Clostridiaceae bacterium]|nr:DUF2975 domain-containing protein [Clostridiaceae bacterium]
MSHNQRNCILTIAIMSGLIVLIIVSIIAGIMLRELSFDVARANPELTYLRIPVLVICYVLISIFIVNLILAEFLLKRILMNSIFTESSVRFLKAISCLFMLGILPLAALFIITELNVSGSITQIYVILTAVLYLTAGLIFRLWANLIRDASYFKQEVDMTV